MTTEQRPPVSRRKLGIFGVVALVGAGLIVATGIRAREDSSAKLREWTDAQAIPTVAVAPPSGRALSPTIDLPGRLAEPVESAAYFAVAEVLANAAKHAQARVVEVHMLHNGDCLRIAVTDDGVEVLTGVPKDLITVS